MKKLLALVACSLILISCNNTNEGSLERVYFENVQLSAPDDDYGTWVLLESGDKTAIRFAYTHPDEVNVSDDELTELFWIEIPSNVTEFNISTGNDAPQGEIEFYYVRSCFCGFEPFTFLRSDISGQKIAPNQWQISFDIVAKSGDTEYELKDSGTYVLSSFEN